MLENEPEVLVFQLTAPGRLMYFSVLADNAIYQSSS